MSNNVELANSIVQFLATIGVEQFYCSPGYRCLPLYSVLDKLNKQTLSVIDERSCAFQALGFSKTKKAIAAACSTSGSAVGHFLPALIEAYHSRTPMVVITCDRPDELRGTDSNQTINQIDVYKNFVGRQFHFSRKDQFDSAAQSEITKNLVEQKLPIHINLSFAEPLESNINQLEIIHYPVIKSTVSREQNTFSLNFDENTLVVVGEYEIDENPSIGEFVGQYKGPLYIDISSPLFNKIRGNNVINYLDHPKSLSWLRDDCQKIVHIGRKLLSNNYYRVLDSREDLKEIWFSDFFPDKILGNRVERTASLNDLEYLKAEPKTNLHWNELVKEVEQHYNKNIKNHSHASFVKEFNEVADFDYVFLGNSTVVRCFQEQGLTNRVNIYLSRGASGIDGNISTAIGIAHAYQEKKVACIIGDLAFLHDYSSIFEIPKNLKVIVLQNYRGGIFSHLPISKQIEQQPNLEKLIMTPHHSQAFDVLDSLSFYGGFVQGALSDFINSDKLIAQYLINHQQDVDFYQELKK